MRMSSYYICEDLVVEIFKRLPPKSLLRFRSVSKSECSCIDSPNFIRLHMLQSPQKVLIIHNARPASDESGRLKHEYFYTLHSPEKLPLCPRNNGYVGITPIEFPFDDYYMLGSCNGIIFMLYVEPREFQRICLWNPSIRRKVKVPDHPVWRYRKGCSSDIIGFGFDPITNDYKIVTISYEYRRGYERNSLVYTMKTGTWSNIASPTTPFSRVERRGSFVNGVFHWVVKRYINVALEICHPYIMTFDLSTHGFGTIELPDPSWKTDYKLIIIHSSLAVISSDGTNNWIWVRREHNNIPSWSVHCNLETFKYVSNWRITTTGNFLFYSCHPDGYFVYNPETRKGSGVVDIGVSSYIATMEMYVESLELLDTGTTCERNQPSFGTTCERNQPSFVEGKKRNRTTLRKLIDFFTLCSTPHKKMC